VPGGRTARPRSRRWRSSAPTSRTSACRARCGPTSRGRSASGRPRISPRRRPAETTVRNTTRACSSQARSSGSDSPSATSANARSTRPISTGVRMRQRRRGSRGRSTAETGFPRTSPRGYAALNSEWSRFKCRLIVRGATPAPLRAMYASSANVSPGYRSWMNSRSLRTEIASAIGHDPCLDRRRSCAGPRRSGARSAVKEAPAVALDSFHDRCHPLPVHILRCAAASR
jgi:hypothetical protein